MGRVKLNSFDGPFSSIFMSPTARVLDEARIVGNMEQTVRMLSDATDLDYKTVKNVLQHLIRVGYVRESRKMGNAQSYRFNVENELHSLLDWATEIQHGKPKRR
jgi:DNA-binding transcriptional regulator YhcF (GntR family)